MGNKLNSRLTLEEIYLEIWRKKLFSITSGIRIKIKRYNSKVSWVTIAQRPFNLELYFKFKMRAYENVCLTLDIVNLVKKYIGCEYIDCECVIKPVICSLQFIISSSSKPYHDHRKKYKSIPNSKINIDYKNKYNYMVNKYNIDMLDYDMLDYETHIHGLDNSDFDYSVFEDDNSGSSVFEDSKVVTCTAYANKVKTIALANKDKTIALANKDKTIALANKDETIALAERDKIDDNIRICLIGDDRNEIDMERITRETINEWSKLCREHVREIIVTTEKLISMPLAVIDNIILPSIFPIGDDLVRCLSY